MKLVAVLQENTKSVRSLKLLLEFGYSKDLSKRFSPSDYKTLWFARSFVI